MRMELNVLVLPSVVASGVVRASIVGVVGAVVKRSVAVVWGTKSLAYFPEDASLGFPRDLVCLGQHLRRKLFQPPSAGLLKDKKTLPLMFRLSSSTKTQLLLHSVRLHRTIKKKEGCVATEQVGAGQ